jgi:uncharacterized membrane protein YdbT with pleckstrin-like domain
MIIEDILLKLKPTRRAFALDYLIILILIGTLIFFQVTGNFINPVGLYGAIGLSTIILIYIEFSRFSNTYYVTKNKLITKKGIIGKQTNSIFFYNISEINLNQSFFQRILKYGDIVINSQAANQIGFEKVTSPKKIIHQIEKLMKYQINQQNI